MPPGEAQRQRVLQEHEILDSPPEAVFDDITALAAEALGAPIALVTLVDAKRQWFKSHHGLDFDETPREWSFCAHAILGDGLFEVPDAAQDARFAGNPLVTDDPKVRFYAGMPIRTSDGFNLGALCVMDREPRRLDPTQRDLLTRLCRLVTGAIEARRSQLKLRQQQNDLRRLTDFNAVLAQVSQIIATAEDAAGLLQAICSMTVLYAHARLAYIARPDESLRFRFLASAGLTDYLDDIVISADAAVVEGQGYAGRVWRGGEALYTSSFGQASELAPWQKRAQSYGFKATATLPIFRDGKVWAVFTVLHGQEGIFSRELKGLLEELAVDISRGLDRLDIIAQERRLSELQKTLLDNTLAGIALVRERHIVLANVRLATMLGYREPTELVGEPTRVLYADDAEYGRLEGVGAHLHRVGPAVIQDVRMARADGREMLCDVSVGLSSDEGVETSVWTYQDVTERDRLQRQLKHQAQHDALTDLPNRRALEEYLAQAIARARRSGTLFAVGLLDLDDFKPVNDTFGHGVGDKLLQELAARLLDQLREADFLARFGGDEFVLVIEDLDEEKGIEQVAGVLNRLHAAVDAPFMVAPGQPVTVNMSMGVSLFPADGEDVGALLRLADAALNQTKAHKYDRSSWWLLGTDDQAEMERGRELDAYGPDAAGLLGEAREVVLKTAARFDQAFRDEVAYFSWKNSVDHPLTDEQCDYFARLLAEHMRYLFDPEAEREKAVARAENIGQVYALMGINQTFLSRSPAIYRGVLTKQLRMSSLAARLRHRVAQVAEVRLNDDLQIQAESYDDTIASYSAVLADPLPQPGSLWRDVLSELIRPIGRLPGVRACTVLRPDTHDQFQVEQGEGPVAESLAQVLMMPEYRLSLDPTVPAGKGLGGRAWHSGRIFRSTALDADERVAHWRQPLAELGLRSMVSIPVADPLGRPLFVIAIYGAYFNQFESLWMRQFAQGLQQRASLLWYVCRTPQPAEMLPHDVAQSYRRRLVAGGLRMFVQPIVDLRDGRLYKVEALARLQLENGQMVAPSVFLPLLGEAELDTLFRMGLDQTLAQLKGWLERGLDLDVSLNLPPTCLHDADCPGWVDEALRRHCIEPHRLTLELLETQEMESGRQKNTVDALVGLGVKLAVDDLGSGYSNLLRLSDLPFDLIKVDQSLTINLRRDPVRTFSLIRNIIQLGSDLERQVVVEGVEDAGAIEAVVILGATLGQGFALAKPMPPDQLADWADSFSPPIEHGAIRSYLGALAHHWLCVRSLMQSAIDLEACPVTRFLRDMGLAESEAARWHAQVHAGHGGGEAGVQLTAWLIEQVQREVPAP